MSVAAAILAAGASRRLGAPKQLVLAGGVPLVRRAALAALATCDAVGVVVGARASRVFAALVGLDVARIPNARWREGVASSIRAAVAWARGHDALVLVVADQPAMDARHLARLIRAHRRGAPVVASRYDGVLGVPALFARGRWDALAALAGDRGARALLRSGRVAHVDLPSGGFDVDTPDDLARLSPR